MPTRYNIRRGGLVHGIDCYTAHTHCGIRLITPYMEAANEMATTDGVTCFQCIGAPTAWAQILSDVLARD